MARVTKESPPPGEAARAAGTPVPSKLEAVRRAMAALPEDCTPQQIVDHVGANTPHVISLKTAASYRSNIRTRAKLRKKARGGRPRKDRAENSPAAPADNAAALPEAKPGMLTLEDVRAIKEVADRQGVERVRQILDLFFGPVG